ncbi:MAG: hypothetical protein ACE5K8_07215 [Candidatus Zixiibacteriota bacterium]
MPVKSITLTDKLFVVYWRETTETFLQANLKIALLFLTSFLILITERAVAYTSPDRPSIQGGFPRYEAPDGVIVDSLVIDNRNIYDTETERYHHFIFKLANKLHYKTRTQVIKSEVLLQVGEPYSSELAEETARNLRQRLQLYDAWVETEKLDNGRLLVRVVTIDEWTLSGGLDVRRDGNETIYRLGVAERNLLGNNQALSLEYFIPVTDDNYLIAGFSDRRFLGRTFALEAGYSDNPQGKVRQISFGRPYYNLLQDLAFGFSLTATGGRRDIYHETRRVAYSHYEGDRAGVFGSYRLGSYKRKISFTSEYLYRYEQILGTNMSEAVNEEDTSVAAAGFPSDSLYHQLGLKLQLLNLNFTKLKQIDGFRYTEDFVLGQALQIGLARAFTGGVDSKVFDFFELGLSQGYRFGPHLTLLTYYKQFWFNDSKDIRRVTSLSANYYNNASRFITIAARVIYLSDSRATGAEAVTVGGTGDIRGYNKVFSTGNKKGVINLEGRFYPDIELLSVVFGGAFFIDAAKSWKSQEALSLNDFSLSIGFGLRVSLERFAKNRLFRIDAAYSEKNGLQLSIGTDQYFRAQAGSFLLTTP